MQRLIAGLQLGHDLTPDQQQQLFTDVATVAAHVMRGGARAAAAAARWGWTALQDVNIASSMLLSGCVRPLDPAAALWATLARTCQCTAQCAGPFGGCAGPPGALTRAAGRSAGVQ